MSLVAPQLCTPSLNTQRTEHLCRVTDFRVAVSEVGSELNAAILCNVSDFHVCHAMPISMPASFTMGRDWYASGEVILRSHA